MDKKISGEITYFLKKSTPYFDARLSKIANEIGLTIQEAHVLLFLSHNPDCDRACDVEAKRGLSKAYVSKAIRSLECKGYVKVTCDDLDKRYHHIEFTNDMKNKIDILKDDEKAIFNSLRKNISDDELNVLKTVIDKIYINFVELEEREKND